MGAENYVTSCDLGIFVDHAAEWVPPQHADTCTFRQGIGFARQADIASASGAAGGCCSAGCGSHPARRSGKRRSAGRGAVAGGLFRLTCRDGPRAHLATGSSLALRGPDRCSAVRGVRRGRVALGDRTRPALFAVFAERVAPQLIRWESRWRWTRPGDGKVSEKETSLASVLARMLRARGWTVIADRYLAALDEIARADTVRTRTMTRISGYPAPTRRRACDNAPAVGRPPPSPPGRR